MFVCVLFVLVSFFKMSSLKKRRNNKKNLSSANGKIPPLNFFLSPKKTISKQDGNGKPWKKCEVILEEPKLGKQDKSPLLSFEWEEEEEEDGKDTNHLPKRDDIIQKTIHLDSTPVEIGLDPVDVKLVQDLQHKGQLPKVVSVFIDHPTLRKVRTSKSPNPAMLLRVQNATEVVVEPGAKLIVIGSLNVQGSLTVKEGGCCNIYGSSNTKQLIAESGSCVGHGIPFASSDMKL